MTLKKTGLTEDQEILVEIKGEHAGTYATKVLDIEDGEFKMAAPELLGVTIPIDRGAKVTVSFTTQRGKFFFISQVQDRNREPLPHYILTRPETIYRVQRRKYVRVEVQGRVDYRPRPDEKEKGEDFVRGQINNISGGGISLQGPLKIDEGEEVELKIPLLEKKSSFFGVVRRLQEGGKRKKPEMGLAFVDIDNREREELIKWLFDYQRQFRGAEED